jgi:hypothetical protein
MTPNDDIWEDNSFHFCALRAYLEIYALTKEFPPDSEATRRLAYRYYEEALAEKNRNRRPPMREAGQECEAPEEGVDYAPVAV